MILGLRMLILSGPCDVNPCQNDGTCTPDGEDFTCQCQSGFTGDMCENGTFMNNN